MENLAGKTAVITGGGRGIGRQIAIALANEGVNVLITARSEDQLKEVKSIIGKNGGTAYTFQADLGKAEMIKSVANEALKKLGHIDFLINNAGTGEFKPVEETTEKMWDTMLNVNAKGPFLLCREIIPEMKNRKSGRIVNIASVAALKGYENQAAYAASKHALLGFTKSMARELSREGIRVHAVCPGAVNTSLISKARPDLDTSDMIQPEDISDIVLFLLKQKSSAVIDEIRVHRGNSSPWA